jgi:polygalacturonase
VTAPVAAFDVNRFGAVGDGTTLSTVALQRAIDACSAAGGGTVLIPAGRYLSGALWLRSHVHVDLASGAVLVASQRTEDFPPIKGREEGVEKTVYASLLTGIDLENVAVTGEGMLDGNGGEFWWKADQATRKIRDGKNLPRTADEPPGAPLKWGRPRMINFIRCRGATLDGFIIKDSIGLNVHLLYCDGVVVNGLTVFQTGPVRSSEAVLVDSSRRIRITSCHLSSGADCIGIKAGYNEDGRRVGLASEDILISNCHMVRTSSGVVIGSETTGSIRNVMFTACVIESCLSAIRIRSPRGRGGVVERIRVSNLIVDQADENVIKVSNFFDSQRSEGRSIQNRLGRGNIEVARSVKAPVDIGTPTFRDFSFSGITVGRAREIALLEGLPERFVHEVAFQNISAERLKGGVFCAMAAGVSISNLRVDALETSMVDAREIEGLEIHGLRCAHPPTGAPLVWMEDVSRAFIHGCDAAAPKWVQHERCRDVTIAANRV